MHEDVGLACRLVFLFTLLDSAQQSIRFEVEVAVELKATERFVALNFAEGVLLVGAEGEDLAAVVDGVDDEAESVQFSDGLAGCWVVSDEVDKGAEATGINQEALVLSKEIGLNLVENASEGTVSIGHQRELPGGVGAPEEHTLRNVALPDVVDSNGHEIVVLNAYSKQ